MGKFLFCALFLLINCASYSQSSTLFPVPSNTMHEGAIMQHVDGSPDLQTFFKLTRSNEVHQIETFVEFDSVSFILIGQFRNRSYYSLILFNTADKNFQELHAFDTAKFIDFSDDLYLDKNGNCLGVVLNGIERDSGFVFSYSLVTNSFSRIMELEKNPFSNLARSFAFDKNSHMLFGMSSKGGVNNLGFLFSLDLNSKSITQLFQCTLISSISMYARHLDYNPNLGLYGYLDLSSNRQILFRLEDNIFTLVHDFDTDLERPTGSVCIVNNKLIGTSFDVVNGRQLIYKIDANGSNREYFSIHRDTAWGASDYKSIFTLNDSTVVYCSFNGGIYDSGNLLNVNINDFSIIPGLSFRSSHGYSPTRMLFSEKTRLIHVHLSSGASGKRGSFLSINLDNNAHVQTDLAGMPFGTTISNSVVEMGNKKIAYIAESGGIYGKGVLGIVDFYSKEIDTVISFGGENRQNDSAFQTPDISSLLAVNDTLLVFHFKAGGPHLRGGMAFFSTKSMALIRVVDFSTSENQEPIGRISSNESGSLLTWTSVDYVTEYKKNLLQISINQGIVDTLFSLKSPIGFFPFSDKQVFMDASDIYIPFIGYEPPFGDEVVSDGLAKFDGSDFDYIEFPYYNFGKLIGTNILKVEKDKIAFSMTSDVDFGFGKLILYDVNTRESEIFPYFDLTMHVRPVGGIYHDNFDNSIYTLASKYGDYGLGGLMKFDLYSRTFSTMVDFGNNPDFSSVVNYSPQITRVHPFPLGTEPIGQLKETGFKLYPNPTNGTFYIDAEVAVDVDIYTIQGSLVHSAHEVVPGSPVSIIGVPNGIYFVRIDGESEMNKLIVH
ncbi:MAG TPA: hypothetical protein DIW47_12185 [Bacteroidetes bacterium]|nr:hypothetical protein [Bacteroidota bacterium]